MIGCPDCGAPSSHPGVNGCTSSFHQPRSGRPSYDPGPFWWRWRCKIADRITKLAIWIEPNDRSSAHWFEGENMVIVDARRRGV